MKVRYCAVERDTGNQAPPGVNHHRRRIERRNVVRTQADIDHLGQVQRLLPEATRGGRVYVVTAGLRELVAS